MRVALLVPGIMATRLDLQGEEVWPPTPLETQFGYDRIEKLQDERARPTELIYNVLCFNFYSTVRNLLAELGYTTSGSSKRYVDFPYDWRRDLFETVDLLAARVKALHDDGATEIALLGHSMGGLLCRLLLESGRFERDQWFSKINIFVALAVPHLGAPLALARIFGVDSTLGISGKDFAKFASNPKYPSGYQLIPAPGEQSLWDLSSDNLAAIDPYDRRTATQLGMVPGLVERARSLHDILGKQNKPDEVRYFYFAGVGHKTVTRVNVELGGQAVVNHKQTVMTRTPDGGDGTVPLYSALPHLGQRQLVVNEHSTVFQGLPFKRVFFRLFGGDAGPPVEYAGGAEAQATVTISIDSPVQTTGEPIEVTFDIIPPATKPGEGVPHTPASTSIEGELVLDLVDGEGQVKKRSFRKTPISYNGPGINRLTIDLPGVTEPGLFVLRFAGSIRAENDVRFAVSQI